MDGSSGFAQILEEKGNLIVSLGAINKKAIGFVPMAFLLFNLNENLY